MSGCGDDRHRHQPVGPSTGEQAREFVAALVVGAGARLWMPADGFWNRLTQLAAELGVQGARVFDLQIALTAFDNGASEIWTHDRHFVSMAGLSIRAPLNS